MKIIILGAGQVGSGMAYSLSREENDISIVDIDPGGCASCRKNSISGPCSGTPRTRKR